MIELRNVTIRAGGFCLPNVSFSVDAGAYAVLMGKSGQGKTTILEAICGVRQVTSGRVFIGGSDVTEFLPGDRQIGYVPQDLALFPTMSVRAHLDFAQTIRRAPRHEVQARTAELAEELGIGHLLERGIHGLSGGEAQRVAVGRALSFRPSLLLLDEPLSALDAGTRAEMYELLIALKKKQVTTLHVTHNLQEAEALADVRLVLENKEVCQISSSAAGASPPLLTNAQDRFQ